MSRTNLLPFVVAFILCLAWLGSAFGDTGDVYTRVRRKSLLYLALLNTTATLFFAALFPSDSAPLHDRLWYVSASAGIVTGLIGWLFNFRYPHLRVTLSGRIIGFDSGGSFVLVFHRRPVDTKPQEYVFVEDGYEYAFSVAYDASSYLQFCLWQYGESVSLGIDIQPFARTEGQVNPFYYDIVRVWQNHRSEITTSKPEHIGRYLSKYVRRSIGRACADRFGFSLSACAISGFSKTKYEVGEFPAIAA